MARYIDADKLEKEFSETVSKHNVVIEGNEYPVFLVDHTLHKIRNFPTADVEEVKHGYWFFTEYDYFDCSVCGEAYYNGCESTKEAQHRLDTKCDLYERCPHCGAKMDGGSKE